MNLQFMKKMGWAYISLPWIGNEIEETIALMGKDYWPYGIGPNKKTLETLFRYSFDQGLSKRELTLEALFYPESFSFKE
jgi:4,5-dihydroxyphthalate decarboxylase